MIKPAILLGCLYRHYITDIFHHTDSGSIPLRISTNLASFSIGYIMTHFAVFHLTFQRYDRISESFHRSRILTEQMQNKPHSRLTPDTRKFGKFADCLFKQYRRILLVHR